MKKWNKSFEVPYGTRDTSLEAVPDGEDRLYGNEETPADSVPKRSNINKAR